MPERQTLTTLVQLGVEAVAHGTLAAATKRLSATMFDMGPKVDISQWRGSGYKYPAVTALNKEWMEGSFSGPLTYDEIVYLLSGCIKTGVVTGASADKTWTFSPATTTEDAITSYSIEQGSAVRAHVIKYGVFPALTIKWDDSGVEVSGDVLGQALVDSHTMTPSGVTEVPLVPATRVQTGIQLADTAAGLGGAAVLSRVISAEWSITNRFAPVWALNQSSSWPVHIESEPEISFKLMLQADAVGMGLLTTMRANSTKFARIACIGATIPTTAVLYSVTLDLAFRVTDVTPFRDEDGIFAIEWTGVGVHDATWTKAYNIVCVNTTASLV